MFQKSCSSNYFKILLVSGVFCAVVWLPIALTPYMATDDYWLQLISQSPECRSCSEYGSYVGVGRYLAAETTCLWARLLAGYDSKPGSDPRYFFVVLRLVNLLFVAGAFSIMWLWLARLVADRAVAFIVTAFIMLLPGFTLYGVWGVLADRSPGLITLMLSVYALPLAPAPGATPGRNWSLGSNSIMRLTVSTLLLIITFEFNQPTAFLFLFAPMAMITLTDEEAWKTYRGPVILAYMVFFIALVVYALGHKFIIMRLFEGHPGLGLDPKKLDFQGLTTIAQNFMEFMGVPFRRSANLWVMSDTRWFGYGVVGSIIVTVVAAFSVMVCSIGYHKRQRSLLIERVRFSGERLLLGVGAVVASAAIPVGYKVVPHYRVLVSLSAVLVLLLVWVGRFWLNTVGRTLGASEKTVYRLGLIIGFAIVAFAGSSAQYYGIRDYVIVQTKERAFLEGALQPLLNGEWDAAYLVGVGYDERGGLHPSSVSVKGDEFGLPSCGQPSWYRAVFMFANVAAASTGVNEVLQVVKRGVVDVHGYRVEYRGGKIWKITAKEVLEKPSGRTGIIDLHHAFYPNTASATLPQLECERISASSRQADYGPEGLLSSNRMAIWHAQSPPVYPEWVEFAFAVPISFDTLVLAPQPECTPRAPRRLSVQASSDGKTWREVAYIQDMCKIYVSGSNSVDLAETVSTKFVRIEIYANCGDPALLTLLNVGFVERGKRQSMAR